MPLHTLDRSYRSEEPGFDERLPVFIQQIIEEFERRFHLEFARSAAACDPDNPERSAKLERSIRARMEANVVLVAEQLIVEMDRDQDRLH